MVGSFTAILVLAFFSPALARQPEFETFKILHDVVVIDCGDFDAIFVDDITGRRITYFDTDGSPNRFEAHVMIDGTVTDSRTGKSFRDQAVVNGSGPLPLDPLELDETHQGVTLHITVPGEGLVALHVGRITTDENGMPTFIAGQDVDRYYSDVICEGLSGL